MIKANELRIGNIINLGGNTLDTYQTYKPHIVCADTIKAIKEENDDNGDDYILSVFQPVELTPEILEAAGFTKYDWFDGYFINTKFGDLMVRFLYGRVIVFFTNVYRDKSGMMYKGKRYIGNVNNTENIKYLHNLQNLYSLTGQELQIDVNKLNK